MGHPNLISYIITTLFEPSGIKKNNKDPHTFFLLWGILPVIRYEKSPYQQPFGNIMLESHIYLHKGHPNPSLDKEKILIKYPLKKHNACSYTSPIG